MDLPAELRLSIVENLDPRSAFNFAITCKANWILCNRIVKHHAHMYALHQVQRWTTPFEVWNLFKTVVCDSDKSDYVREISYDVVPPFADHNHNLDHHEWEKVDKFEYNIPSDLVVKAQEQRWSPLTLLVHFLPALETLRFNITDYLEPLDEGFVYYVAEKYAHMKELSPHKIPDLPFRNLKTVIEVREYPSSQNFSDAEWCRIWLAIPSLRTYVARKLTTRVWAGVKSFSSNLTELVLLRCRLGSSDMQRILKSTALLERFTMEIEEPPRRFPRSSSLPSVHHQLSFDIREPHTSTSRAQYYQLC
ncbi:hypothetical protein M011DRAFT_264207 [Sporormia fimetaria CBS 119925]|uniref:F-box domain-containing protein n=1 Tax=Sporormia fimetaria CBS 119925 TaxID=1340428 RepID=A0A6A6UYV8_9PLEO|nr:hypothetical protein M011DRAFT_264207 [Sporormia fimetaria CBS 119925]